MIVKHSSFLLHTSRRPFKELILSFLSLTYLRALKQQSMCLIKFGMQQLGTSNINMLMYGVEANFAGLSQVSNFLGKNVNY